MNYPQNQSSEVLKNLNSLYKALSDCCVAVRCKLNGRMVTGETVKILSMCSVALGMVNACCLVCFVNFETAQEVHKLCKSLRVRMGHSPIAKRCEELALEILADIPISFEITGSGHEQISERPCRSSVFCDFYGCVGACNRSVCDD